MFEKVTALWTQFIAWCSHAWQVVKLACVVLWHSHILGKKKLRTMSVAGLPAGKYVQIYRGSMSAAQVAGLGDKLDELKKLGVTGIAWHGFTTEMNPVVFARLTKLCTDRGMLSIAAFGMGSQDPVGMGTRMGKVGLVPGCLAVMFDMEGAWDSGKQVQAVQLGQAFRAVAPNVLTIDQPWPVPTVHWQFPWEETAAFIQIRAPQYYVNDWTAQHGDARYAKCWAWFDSAWAKLNSRLAPKNLVRPQIVTIQGYRWVFHDLVNCLMTNDTVIVWAEPFPDAVFMLALDVVVRLQSLGFSGANGVRQFQEKWNKDHTMDLLTADNSCGPKTALRLGVTLPVGVK